MSRHVLFLRNDGSEHSPEPELTQEELLFIQQEQERKEADERHKTRMLVISFCLMLVFGLANKVTQIIQLDYIENYPLFLSLITTVIYIPVSFLYIWPMIKWGSAITIEQRNIPTMLWVKIGFLDSLAGIMQILTINIIHNGTLVVLLAQTAIPISMICSKYFLGAKYTAAHYFGVTIVLAGLLIVLLPRFINKKKDDSDDGPSTTKLLIAVGAFVASNIPMCFSTVIKELALGEQDVDAMYMNGWVAIFQFLFSIPLLIPSSFAENVPVKELPQHIWDGTKCWLGINTIKNTTNAMAAMGLLYYTAQQISTSTTLQRIQTTLSNSMSDHNRIVSTQEIIDMTSYKHQPNQFTQQSSDDIFTYTQLATPFADSLHSVGQLNYDLVFQSSSQNDSFSIQGGGLQGKKKPDNCSKSPFWTNAYMVANIFYNILIILLIKYGSSNLFYICMTLMLPLSSVAFALPFMPSPKPLSKFDIIGLVVLLIGLIIYRFHGLFLKKKAETTTTTDTTIENQQSLLSDTYDSTGSMNNGVTTIDQERAAAVGFGTTNSNLSNNSPYYTNDLHASVDDPFDDGYQPAENATVIPDASINQNRKKGKKTKK